MKNKIKTIFTLLIFMMSVVPSTIYACDDTVTRDDNMEASSTQELTLDSAEIMVLMNTRGELYSSRTIHNLNDENVFIISIKEDKLLKTYLVEQGESTQLIEESRI